MNLTAAKKIAAARLAKLGRVHALKVTDVGGWYCVDATIARGGYVGAAYGVGPDLDALLASLGC